MFKKIYIEITNYCNLKCSFCKTNVRDKNFMDFDKFCAIIHKIKNHTKYIYLHVLGEPLLHKNLYEILLFSKQNNLKVNITTNGTLLKENLNIFLDNSIDNIHVVNISAHSEYKNILSEDDFINNVISFINQTNERFNINIRLWNEDDYNISHNNLELVNKIFNGVLINNQLGHNNIISVFSRNKSIKVKNKLFISIDKKFTWPNLNNKEVFLKGKCYGLIDQIAILVDGTVVPCCLDGEGHMNLGNIFFNDLDSILKNEKAILIKNNFIKKQVYEPYCKTCGFAVRNNS